MQVPQAQSASFFDAQADAFAPHVLILGTGGTIAGTASAAQGDANYTAATLGVAQLVAAVPALAGANLRTRQIAQIDSKDMNTTVWCDLAEACLEALEDAAVQGIVITHGTDTLEETAVWLDMVLPGDMSETKPIVLTCAMRPASSADADGPQNLADAVTLAQRGAGSGLCGVMVVVAGEIHDAIAVRKVHTHRPDAFSSGDEPLVGRFSRSEGAWVTDLKEKEPAVPDFATLFATKKEVTAFLAHVRSHGLPWVEIIHSHAEASGKLLERLFSNPSDAPSGLVVAGTGNATVHAALLKPLEELQQSGVLVSRSSRCVLGAATHRDDDTLSVLDLVPAKARVLMQIGLGKGRMAASNRQL